MSGPSLPGMTVGVGSKKAVLARDVGEVSF